MRPVPPCTAAPRVVAAVPGARVSLQGTRRALSSRGLRSAPTPAARTCRRTQHLWGRISGAMTAALVIVPTDPVVFAPAHRGQWPGSTVEPQEVPKGAPWMVRLSMGSTDVMLRVTSAARHAPARTHFLGSRP